MSGTGPIPNSQPLPSIAPEEVQTDLGRARLFSRWYQGQAYISRNSWYVWDEPSKRWLDEAGGGGVAAIGQLAQAFLMRLVGVAESMRIPMSHLGSDGLMSARTIRSLLSLIKIQPEFQLGKVLFDADPYLLGVSNGVVDLRTGRLMDNRRELMVTLHSPVEYKGAAAKSPVWDQFVLDVAGHDKEYSLFLREYFGYMLTGSNELERFTIMKGEGGTGKSTFVGAIRAALGHYSGTTDHDTFSLRAAGAIREDIASFSGKRLIVDMELPNGHSLDMGIIKLLSGRDEIRARKLYKGGVYITPTWSIVVGCNKWPKLSADPDSGWWRRVLVLPFDHKPAKTNYRLKETLHKREHQEAILSWLVAGSRAYYRNHRPNREWPIPKPVRDAIIKYRVYLDPVGFWMRRYLEFLPTACESNADLSAAYNKFCDSFNIESHNRVNPTWLGRRLSENGCTAIATNRGRMQLGVRIKPPIQALNTVLGDEEDEQYLVSAVEVSD